jgi:hypothetical protein
MVGGWVGDMLREKENDASRDMTDACSHVCSHATRLASPRLAPPAQLMSPDDMFTSYVQSGTSLGRLADEDLCNLTASHC